MKTNDSVILKNTKKFDYPDFYKILITPLVASNLRLNEDTPLVEVIEIKKNSTFIAKKTKIYQEERKISSSAPVENIKIDNISKNQSLNKKIPDRFYINIAEFYSAVSASNLKKRIVKELTEIDSKNLIIKTKKTNKTSLMSGPYNSINLMKNDYIMLKNFGFEDLEISINE